MPVTQSQHPSDGRPRQQFVFDRALRQAAAVLALLLMAIGMFMSADGSAQAPGAGRDRPVAAAQGTASDGHLALEAEIGGTIRDTWIVGSRVMVNIGSRIWFYDTAEATATEPVASLGPFGQPIQDLVVGGAGVLVAVGHRGAPGALIEVAGLDGTPVVRSRTPLDLTPWSLHWDGATAWSGLGPAGLVRLGPQPTGPWRIVGRWPAGQWGMTFPQLHGDERTLIVIEPSGSRLIFGTVIEIDGDRPRPDLPSRLTGVNPARTIEVVPPWGVAHGWYGEALILRVARRQWTRDLLGLLDHRALAVALHGSRAAVLWVHDDEPQRGRLAIYDIDNDGAQLAGTMNVGLDGTRSEELRLRLGTDRLLLVDSTGMRVFRVAPDGSLDAHADLDPKARAFMRVVSTPRRAVAVDALGALVELPWSAPAAARELPAPGAVDDLASAGEALVARRGPRLVELRPDGEGQLVEGPELFARFGPEVRLLSSQTTVGALRPSAYVWLARRTESGWRTATLPAAGMEESPWWVDAAPGPEVTWLYDNARSQLASWQPWRLPAERYAEHGAVLAVGGAAVQRLTGDASRLLIAGAGGVLALVDVRDPESPRVVTADQLAGGVDAMALAGRRAWVSHDGGRELLTIDVRVTAPFGFGPSTPLADAPVQLAMSPDGDVVWAVGSSGTLQRIRWRPGPAPTPTAAPWSTPPPASPSATPVASPTIPLRATASATISPPPTTATPALPEDRLRLVLPWVARLAD